MSLRGRNIVALSVAGLVCAAVPAIFLLNAGADDYKVDLAENVLGAGAALVSTAVGLLLALRRPWNPIGWLLLGNGVVLAIAGLAPAYAGYALNHPGSVPSGRLAAIWDTEAWPILFAGVVAIAFVFPDGKLPAREGEAEEKPVSSQNRCFPCKAAVYWQFVEENFKTGWSSIAFGATPVCPCGISKNPTPVKVAAPAR